MNPEIHGPISKGKTRKQIKARKDRAEAKVKTSVRTACVARDGQCRYFRTIAAVYDGWAFVAALHQIQTNDKCDGPSQWAHIHAKRRSQTRGQTPELRHDTAHSLMLCRFHHTEYDAHRLLITALSRKGADGPLKFRRAR